MLHICANPACKKPFSTSHARVKFCSRTCYAKMRPSVPLAIRIWTKINICIHGEYCPYCCWEWQGGRHAFGYGIITHLKDGAYKGIFASRVVWEVLNKRSIPQGLHALHHCDNPPCCSIWHIYVGTNQDNTRDAKQRNRFAFGERRSTLKDADVLSMKDLYRQGATQQEIGRQFGITNTAVLQVLHGIRWRHLDAALDSKECAMLTLQHRQAGNIRRTTTILAAAQVQTIRDLHQEGAKVVSLAQQFGVKPTTIQKIVTRKLWKHI